jgi:hypothetical protein
MTSPTEWLLRSRQELGELIRGEGRSNERKLQEWLERHPAFVPGAAGMRGMSGWRPWPSALITQPTLTGFGAKVPDFCWLSVNSAELTAVLVEIEVPAKRWMVKDGARQHADLTQARGQIDAWRAWFNQPQNAVRFLDDYKVPDSLRELHFDRHYVLVHGSREEYEDDAIKTRHKGSIAKQDETLMPFERLLEISTERALSYGCVRRGPANFEAVAVTPTWDPDKLDPGALIVTTGYEDAVNDCEELENGQRQLLIDKLRANTPATSPRIRFKP